MAIARRTSSAALIGLFCLLAASVANAATVASITLTETSKTLIAGKMETIKATAKDSKGHAITGVTFTWSASSTKVLSISSTGVAKGLFPGASTVKVTGGGKSASVAITVVVASIALTEPSKTLQVGSHETIKAVAKDSLGHAIAGVTFKWSSTASTVVKVGTTGIATAMAAGTATITAAVGTKSAGVLITAPEPALSSASGTAATGAAIAGATVTIVDANGKTASTTTADDGSYTLSTAGMAPPFMVSVQLGDTPALYSVSDSTGSNLVINVTPLTDLIIRSWYSVQGKDVATAFTAPVANPPPSPAEVQIIGNVVVQVTALWLQQNGVDTSNFSYISTPFTAGSPGVDGVLDETTVDTGTGTVTITDGAGTTQDSTVSYGDGSMTVDTSTTSPNGDSSSVAGTVVATTPTMQTALAGISTGLTNFTNTVNTKGTALKATDLLPFFDTNLLDEGLTKAEFADSTATQFRGDDNGAITVSFQVLNIQSLDTTNGLADVNFIFTESQGDQSQSETIEFFFKQQSNGSWLFYGDQMPAKLGVQSEMRTNEGAFTGDNGPDINVDIRPKQGVYSGITIDDNGLGIFTNTALNKDGTEADVFIPDPAAPKTTVTINRDEFFANSGVLKNLVTAGTPLTVTMTLASDSSTKQYTVHTNAFTTESISITSPTGATLADATLDTPLHVVWTLPTSFAIAQVKLSGTVFDGDQTQNTTTSCQVKELILSTNATSADITLPSTVCGSNGATMQANLNLNVTGVNGERESVIYFFNGIP